MILTTHSLIGASVAAVLTKDPVIAFSVGMASHYLSDTIPHWDYELGSKINDDPKNPLGVDLDLKSTDFIFDLSKVMIDLAFGILASIFIFISLLELNPLIVILGAVGGALPDFLQLAYMKIRREPFVTLQKIHNFFHSEKYHLKEKPVTGALWQLGLVLLVVISSLALLVALN
ncbi:MAG: hypothetical protein A2607_00030 [Candidatus Vogelbacteria bacterium RIFOXYD1_FULL_42_15]|uniref:Uncharacterized protein n=1 Tax=Candidatus Vogelbacteria bacterium RIFOXYD1_FULL_42_15 TaxID=1802437 RepID=A0A1G2QFC4_9BACT|nr:MAG: hypothetical protein A2607_00030 [Candidatus Vogelbacteria bacterium RIFOXYD1_FULL_42_15]